MKAVDWLRDNADRMALARANRIYLEAWVKTVKAQQMLRHPGASNAAQETLALSSTDYLAALVAYREAIEIDEKYRFLAQAAEAQFEAWRTLSANQRKGV